MEQQPTPAKKSVIRRFFGMLNQILTGLRKVVTVLLNLVFIVVIIVLLSSLLGRGTTPEPTTGPLLIGSGMLVDQKTYDAPLTTILNGPGPNQIVVRDLIRAIDTAAVDEGITALILRTDGLSGGISKIQEVGRAINRFKETGKPVIAAADYFGQNQYLLASYADEIWITPMGFAELSGYGIYQPYLQEAINKLKINFHVFRAGDYKDAVEPILGTAMSEESREQWQLLLDDVWNEFTGTVLANRESLSPEQLDDYLFRIDQLMETSGGDIAEVALSSGLVDHIGTRDEISDRIDELTGMGEEDSSVRVAGYLRANPADTTSENKIGLIVADGEILDGSQPAGFVGGDSLSELIRQAREEEDLSALVIRVNSPGGSAFASELIRRETELTRESGIPVVISMGSMAASGGYWISMGADRLVATPTTITGSIGAFSLVPTFEESLAALGIYSDGVGTTPLSDAFQLDRPMSDQVKAIMQFGIDQVYAQFLGLVADNRGISITEVEAIASGRVWTGAQALERNLVDELGHLEDAIELAAGLAEVEDYNVRTVEAPLTFAEELARSIAEQVSLSVAGADWIQAYRPLMRTLTEASSNLSSLNDPNHQYLICSSCSSEL